MKKNNQKLLTLALLAGTASISIHLLNRFITSTSQLKNMLEAEDSQYYNWRFGDIYYTKKGSGSPLLLIHDLSSGASAYEWNNIESELSKNYTVYSLDLLGCGRSEKPGITYTNFLFVQLICDFIKDIIGEKTTIISSGFSCSFGVTACSHENELINKLILINPPSLKQLQKIPTPKKKLFKYILESPIFGTLIYHMIVSHENISNTFIEKLFYNPFHVKQKLIDTYYESAHKGGYYNKFLCSSIYSKYVNINIEHALATIDNSIYIIEGATEVNCNPTIDEYSAINSSIESTVIPHSKHFPHIEEPSLFLDQLNIFLS